MKSSTSLFDEMMHYGCADMHSGIDESLFRRPIRMLPSWLSGAVREMFDQRIFCPGGGEERRRILQSASFLSLKYGQLSSGLTEPHLSSRPRDNVAVTRGDYCNLVINYRCGKWPIKTQL